MKLLFVVQAYYPARGGVEWLVQNIAERLVRDYGDEVTVLTTTAVDCQLFTDPSLPALPVGEEQINGVSVRRSHPFNRLTWLRLNAARIGHKLNLPGQDWLRTLYFGPIMPGLRREVAATTADLVLAAPFPRLLMYDALAGARKAGKPLVFIGAVHTTDPWGYLLPRMFRAIRGADKYIALSGHEAEFLQRHAVPVEKIEIVGGGVDPAPFAAAAGAGAGLREQLGLGPEPVVLLLGRQTSYKRADLIISAMQQVWETVPEAQLLLAGSQTSYTADLRQQVRSLPAAQQNRVVFLSDFAEDDKPAVVAAADMLVNPSERESFGIVFLEAWAAGKPVIGARSGAAPTVILDGVDGLLAEYGDVKAWAAAIRRLLRDPELRRQLGENGRRKVAERYSWAQITAKTRRILQQVRAQADNRGE